MEIVHVDEAQIFLHSLILENSRICQQSELNFSDIVEEFEKIYRLPR
jgi:hypothetical protein